MTEPEIRAPDATRSLCLALNPACLDSGLRKLENLELPNEGCICDPVPELTEAFAALGAANVIAANIVTAVTIKR